MFEKARVSVFLSVRALARVNIRTTLLTITIMSLIVINLIFLPSIITGIGEVFSRASIEYAVGDVTIKPIGDRTYIEHADGILKKIKSTTGVQGASARYEMSATVSKDNTFAAAVFLGINPEDEREVTVFADNMVQGEFVSSSDTNEVVIGLNNIAGSEEDDELTGTLRGAQVGDRVNVTYRNGVVREYRVKGIYTGGSFISDQFALISKQEAESVLGVRDKASTIIVRSDKRFTNDALKQELYTSGVKEEIKTSEETLDGIIGDVVDSFSILTIVSTIVSLIIAIVVLFMVIYINTLNRKRQIGVLKALGVSEEVIIGSYVMQSLFYTLSAMFIGGIILYGIISYLIQNPVPFPPGPLIPIVEVSVVLQSVVSLLITAVIAGFLPSWSVTRRNIIESIGR